MTRKDYEKAAEIVRIDFRHDSIGAGIVERAFVGLFKGDNPRFDEDRFLLACRPSEKKPAKKR